MAGKPNGWNRLRAKLAGEVPAAELEAYRRAGGFVFDLMDQVERRRLECGIDGLDPWTVPAATRAAFLCAWNAFVLQTLANDLVDADFALDPPTAGHLPPATAAQALKFYHDVDGWVSRAAQAQANPDYRLDVPVPAPLPRWLHTRPISPAHLHGLVHAMRAVHEHADAAMAFLPSAPPANAEKAAQLHRIRQLHASAQVHARYAEELGTAAPSIVHERGGDHARSAIEQFYLLGQLVADPALASRLPAAEPPRAATAPKPAAPAAKGPPVVQPPPPAAKAPTPRPAPRTAPPAPADGPRLLGGWPLLARLGQSFARSLAAGSGVGGAVPASKLVTRRDEAREHTITEPADYVDFVGTLRHEARFELRPAVVRGPWGETVVMRVYVRGRAGFLAIAGAMLVINMDGLDTVLHPWPGGQGKQSMLAKRALYEERVDYPLPVLAKLCGARRLELRFASPYGTLALDAATVARVQRCCRGFLRALQEQSSVPDPQKWLL